MKQHIEVDLRLLFEIDFHEIRTKEYHVNSRRRSALITTAVLGASVVLFSQAAAFAGQSSHPNPGCTARCSVVSLVFNVGCGNGPQHLARARSLYASLPARVFGASDPDAWRTVTRTPHRCGVLGLFDADTDFDAVLYGGVSP